MRNLVLILLTFILVSHVPTPVNNNAPQNISTPTPNTKPEVGLAHKILYKQIGLSSILKFEAFEQALQGYEQLDPTNKGILTVIDFSLPSTEKRMVVIDMVDKKVLYHNVVSHGRASGEKYATSFSNRHESHQSSLGFYVTQNTYQGSNGYSLRLDGLEKGINDQAKARAIVIHGADYANESIIASTGRLGRSYGCPALPQRLNRPIINTIKDGTLVYIYAENEEYIAKTKIVKSKDRMMLAQQKDEGEKGLL